MEELSYQGCDYYSIGLSLREIDDITMGVIDDIFNKVFWPNENYSNLYKYGDLRGKCEKKLDFANKVNFLLATKDILNTNNDPKIDIKEILKLE